MSANGLHRIRCCLLCAWLRLARTDEGFCRQPSRRCVLLTQAGGPFAEQLSVVSFLHNLEVAATMTVFRRDHAKYLHFIAGPAPSLIL